MHDLPKRSGSWRSHVPQVVDSPNMAAQAIEVNILGGGAFLVFERQVGKLHACVLLTPTATDLSRNFRELFRSVHGRRLCPRGCGVV